MLTLTSSTVEANKASEGAGIYNYGVREGSVNLETNSTVKDNTASTKGGGVFNYAGGAVTLTDSTVTANQAEEDGGGIYNEGKLTLLKAGSVSQNKANEDGGGIYNQKGTLSLYSTSSVTLNEASGLGSGGGIYNNETEGATVVKGNGWTGSVSGNLPENEEPNGT